MDQDVGAALEHVVRKLHLDPEHQLINQALDWVSSFAPSQLRTIGAATMAYALLYLIEGGGLLLGYRWAEYLIIIITGSFMPLELYEFIRKFTAVRVTILTINVIIVAYLVYQLRKRRG